MVYVCELYKTLSKSTIYKILISNISSSTTAIRLYSCTTPKLSTPHLLHVCEVATGGHARSVLHLDEEGVLLARNNLTPVFRSDIGRCCRRACVGVLVMEPTISKRRHEGTWKRIPEVGIRTRMLSRYESHYAFDTLSIKRNFVVKLSNSAFSCGSFFSKSGFGSISTADSCLIRV